MLPQSQRESRICCNLPGLADNEEETCVNNGIFALVVFFVVVITEITIVVIYRIVHGHDMDAVLFGSLFRQGAMLAFGCIIAVTLVVFYKRILKKHQRRREDTIRLL